MIERYGSASSDDFFRLFMIPGMPHCAPEVVSAASPAARGPNFVPYAEYDATIKVTPENDALTALQDWVEKGRICAIYEKRFTAGLASGSAP